MRTAAFTAKTSCLRRWKRWARSLDLRSIAYGMNADDTQDFRPGQRAAQQHAVLAPLAEAGLTKLEVRTLANAAGYPVWDRPAAPCLSSRVEYGRTVTREVLEQVERAKRACGSWDSASCAFAIMANWRGWRLRARSCRAR